MNVDILVSGRHGGGLGSCQPGRRLPALGGEVTMMIMMMIMTMMVMMMTSMMTIACVSKVQNGQRSTWRIPVWGFVKLKLAVEIFSLISYSWHQERTQTCSQENATWKKESALSRPRLLLPWSTIIKHAQITSLHFKIKLWSYTYTTYD